MKQLRSTSSRSNLSVSRLGKLFGVAKSSFYQSLKTSQNADKVNQINALKDKAIAMFKRHKRRIGYRELVRHLSDSGIKITNYLAYQIMRKHGLKARSYKRKSYKKPSVAPNNLLKREFNQSAPNQAWAGDITYLQAGGKTVYLAVIMDLYARRIIAWQLKESMDAALVCDLFKQAMYLRGYPSDLLFHSDRGSQYTSADFVQLLRYFGVKQSLSGVQACYDNAVVERFFRTLKTDADVFGQHCLYSLRLEIADFIDHYYNTVRFHCANNHLTPQKKELIFFANA